MQAFQVTGTTIDDIRQVELPDPRPAPGEVVVRLTAAALNFRDLALLRGNYSPRPAEPYVPLSDGAGVVAAVGAGVTRAKVGDRVVLQYVRDWVAGEPTAETMRARFGGPLDGMLAQLIAVPEHAIVMIPDGLSTEDAATLPVAGTAAWHALFDFGGLKPGETVVVQGTGGVSTFALQLAHAAGARVLLTTRSTGKIMAARELGADEVIDTIETPEWDRRVLDLTSGRGADLVLDVVGGEAVQRSLRALKTGGRLALVGFLASAEVTLDLRAVIQRRIDLRGVSVGPRASLEALARAVAALKLRPVVGASFHFADARQAFAQLEKGSQMGKVLVRFPQS